MNAEVKIEDLIEKNHGDKCLLCGGPPAVVGLFVPEAPEKWGAAHGKDRFFRYCLCQKCSETADARGRVEKVIRSEVAGGEVVAHG